MKSKIRSIIRQLGIVMPAFIIIFFSIKLVFVEREFIITELIIIVVSVCVILFTLFMRANVESYYIIGAGLILLSIITGLRSFNLMSVTSGIYVAYLILKIVKMNSIAKG